MQEEKGAAYLQTLIDAVNRKEYDAVKDVIFSTVQRPEIFVNAQREKTPAEFEALLDNFIQAAVKAYNPMRSIRHSTAQERLQMAYIKLMHDEAKTHKNKILKTYLEKKYDYVLPEEQQQERAIARAKKEEEERAKAIARAKAEERAREEKAFQKAVEPKAPSAFWGTRADLPPRPPQEPERFEPHEHLGGKKKPQKK